MLKPVAQFGLLRRNDIYNSTFFVLTVLLHVESEVGQRLMSLIKRQYRKDNHYSGKRIEAYLFYKIQLLIYS